MSTDIIADADHKMARAVDAMERDFQGLRTGGPRPPWSSASTSSTTAPRRRSTSWPGSASPSRTRSSSSRGTAASSGAIEKAITKSDIGLMPNVDGTVVRLNIPPLTEERRKDLVRVVHKRMEEARVEIRNLRRDAADHLKREERDGTVGDRRGPSPARDAPADDRSAHRRGRSPRQREGTGGPRGLVARAPLARPTDAPPAAHGPAHGPDRAATGVPVGEPPLLPAEELPRHVAIIMDGNRRWARQRDLSELDGHAAGVEAIRELLRHAVRRGVPVMTLYAFSRENWARSDEEVTGLFGLLEAAIRSETAELQAQGVRIRLLGRLDELPEATRASIGEALGATAGGDRLLLNIASTTPAGPSSSMPSAGSPPAGSPADQIDEGAISASLYTAGLPDPDLVIRTGGEQRLSNFLIWQSAYAEFYSCDALWPDFGPDAFDAALLEFARRHRRFGR